MADPYSAGATAQEYAEQSRSSVARVRDLVIAIQGELDLLHANAASARLEVSVAREKHEARLAASDHGDAPISSCALAFEALMEQIKAAEDTKAIALETELVDADEALEEAIAVNSFAEDVVKSLSAEAASGVPESELDPRARDVQARVVALNARLASLPLGPVAEATLQLLPPTSPGGAAPELKSLLGSLLTATVTAADVVVTRLWILAPSSAPAADQ